MKLVLAEKPSVAQSIVEVAGATKCCNGYLEGSNYVICWCVDHLVKLANQEIYDGKYAKWNKEDLLILSDQCKYKVLVATIKKLVKRENIESLVCSV